MDFLCFFCLVFAMPLCASVYMCLKNCGQLLGKGSPIDSHFLVSNFEFVTFPLVSWVRCGT